MISPHKYLYATHQEAHLLLTLFIFCALCGFCIHGKYVFQYFMLALLYLLPYTATAAQHKVLAYLTLKVKNLLK